MFDQELIRYLSLEERLLTEIMIPSHQSTSKIRKILSHEIDVDIAKRFGNNAIHHASKLGYYNVLKLLVNAGGDPSRRNDSGQTALIIASRGTKRAHSKCVEYLLENQCDVNATDHEGRIALRQAILASNVKTVELLLQFGSNRSWGGQSQHIAADRSPMALQLALSRRPSRTKRLWQLLPSRLKNILSSNEKIISLLRQTNQYKYDEDNSDDGYHSDN